MTFTRLDDLPIYRDAARYSDRVYALVRAWQRFDSDSVGLQLVRASDSIGANIAEGFGRYHYAERTHFFYYARGSAYETIFWLKRAEQRTLLQPDTAQNAICAYLELIESLNRVIKATKSMRNAAKPNDLNQYRLAESATEYVENADTLDEVPF